MYPPDTFIQKYIYEWKHPTHIFDEFARLETVTNSLHCIYTTVQTEQAGYISCEPGRMATVDFNIYGTVVTYTEFVGVSFFFLSPQFE